MDSLERTLSSSSVPDSTKLQNIIKLQKYYSYDDRAKALSFGKRGLELADQLGDKKNKAWVLNYLGSTCYYSGVYDSAMYYHSSALEIRLTIDDKKGLGASYNNLGNLYDDQGKTTIALNYYLNALKYFEEIGFKAGIGIVYNSLGNLYYTQKKIDLALYYYQKSLKLQQKLNDPLGIGHAYNNIAIMYDEKKDHKKALEYYNKTLAIAEQTGNVGDRITGLNNIGQLYVTLKEYRKAEEALRLSLSLNSKENDTVKMVSPNVNLGYLFKEQKQYDSALVYYRRGIICAKAADLKASLKEVYSHMAVVYALRKDFEQAYRFELMYDEVKDTLFNEESSRQLNELQTKYDTEKKEQTIALLEKDKTIDRNIRNFIIGISVLGLILSIVLLFAFKSKLRSNKLLAHQKVEILSKNKDLQAKNDLIGHQKKEITDSIEYAKTIQHAMLPSPDEVKEVFSDCFVLFKPKDIVSGDFYWFKKIGSTHLVAAVDCTGHGVPGAFMSMIGNDKLNFAVQEKKLTHPAEILSELNRGVKAALKQNESTSKSRDGMDICLCAFDDRTKKLEYAGANRVLYKISNGELTEYPPTKSAIGGFTSEDFNYQNNSIDYSAGDLFYLFTDGYADQFGGDTGKKLMTKNFKKFLLSICDKPMEEQRRQLNDSFDEWKGDFEQIDDVLVVAFKI